MINFIIGFIVGAMIMMYAIGLMSYQKDKKPRNKVRFYVKYDIDMDLECLYVDNLYNIPTLIAAGYDLLDFGISEKDFKSYKKLKPHEYKEVYLDTLNSKV